ncbi:MAG: ABC transporter permease subunit [Planctomycetota bacterium]
MTITVISFRRVCNLLHTRLNSAWAKTEFAHPTKLVGPIFDKELRVSSRRRRSYVLRVGYIALLSVFIMSAWYSTVAVRSSGSGVYQVSRLSLAATQMTATIVWFQFIAAQVLAIVMLSSAISDEVTMGTLGVLMTTPITSFQIVTGKLLSRLLQLMLLLAISLPLLAIVRVFGGVPWDYVVSSVCITLTAAVFAGALSLLLSMVYRHAYTVIIVVISGYMLVFGVLPGVLLAAGMLGRQAMYSWLALINPFWAMAAATQRLSVPSTRAVSWPLHCVVMLAATAGLLAVAVWRVRKAALGDAFSSRRELRLRRFLKRRGIAGAENPGSRFAGYIRPVTGRPIVWKEMSKGFIGHGRGDVVIIISLAATFVVMAVLLLFNRGARNILPYYLTSGVSLVVMVRLAVFAAGSITLEKEARTWPILLTTPLEDREIIRGKAVAAFRRNLPLLLAYFALFCVFFQFHAGQYRLHQIVLYILCFAAGLIGSILFVIGSGCYFGVRLRTTTAAVAATVGLYAAMNYLLCGMFNPFRIWLYRAISRPGMLWTLYAMPMTTALINAAIGLLLARRAVRRLRRDIF